ncbi:MAG: RnfH family protein [Pseudohongiellaceae bacterium]
MVNEPLIPVEVAYAAPDQQVIIPLQVTRGTVAIDAVRQSNIANRFPAITDSDPMGIFSKPLNGVELPLPSDYTLQPGDRVEIYRPLLIDPKQARLARAKKST